MKRVIAKIKEIVALVLSSKRGKNLFLYLIFLFISAIFWLLLTLNNHVQYEYTLPLNVNSIPEDVKFITDCPSGIKVIVREKGSMLLRYSLGNQPSIDVNFSEFADEKGNFKMQNNDIKGLVNNAFGNNITLVSVMPDSISCKYTSLPPKKVPIVYDIHVTPNYQFVLSRNYKVSQDSVLIYGSKESLRDINYVQTMPLVEKDIKETYKGSIDIKPIKGVRVEPQKVGITIPIEQLITKSATISIVSKGVPYGVDIISFPSKVVVSYLIPASEYKQNQNFVAEIYYEEINTNSNKLKVYLNERSWHYGDISLSVDSVEYLLEETKR